MLMKNNFQLTAVEDVEGVCLRIYVPTANLILRLRFPPSGTRQCAKCDVDEENNFHRGIKFARGKINFN